MKHIDNFVKAVSGKSLSQRNIDKLAYGYFRGNSEIKKQIEEGNVEWTLKKLSDGPKSSYTQEPELSTAESDIIRDMELLQKYMTKVRRGLLEKKEGSPAFMKNIAILIGGILDRIKIFEKEIMAYDTGKHQGND